MIKHLYKLIWAQRRTNGWIFAELLVVMCAVWWMADKLFVDLKTYHTPLGFDITNTWNFKMKKISTDSPSYIPDSLLPTTVEEDLQQLVRHLQQHPAIAEVSFSIASLPYSPGLFRNDIRPVDGDTANRQGQFFAVKYVNPNFFNLFRILDINGQPLTSQLTSVTEDDAIVTLDMAENFFHERNVKGRKLGFSGGTYTIPIIGVTQSIRLNEFDKGDLFYYQFIMPDFMNYIINRYGAGMVDISVRTKQHLSQDDMDRLLEEMGPRLQVNNLKINTATSFEEIRKDSLKAPLDMLRKNLSFIVFLLLNIFLGIVGTFWLKTQHRQGELGLRIAIGASRWDLRKYIYMEALLLLLLTVPFTLAFMLNMAFLDILDTYRQPLSITRFAVTYIGSYLLMGGMICLGIWFPVHKISRIAPAEALHYE